MGIMDAHLRRPSFSGAPRPHKKARTEDDDEVVVVVKQTISVRETGAKTRTLFSLAVQRSLPAGRDAHIIPKKVAAGPTSRNLRRFDLWKQGNLCDVDIKCNGVFVVKASKEELSVYSDWFRRLFTKQTKEKITEANIEDVDAATVEALIRSLYENEITLTLHSAPEMLALADNIQVEVVKTVVESYLIMELDKDNAIDALYLAEKHGCRLLRAAAIPLASVHFERINNNKLAMLPFADLKELLGSQHLAVTHEPSLFGSIKAWSQGVRASRKAEEANDQLMSLTDEIRLENIEPQLLNQILDDAWMQEHPKVLRAVAKAVVKNSDTFPLKLAKPKAAKVVRFRQWSKKAENAGEVDSEVHPICSETFRLEAGDATRAACHIQMYPKQAKEGHVPSLGIFLAVGGGVEFPGCILTLVNQRKPLQSVSKEFTNGVSSENGSLAFWGSKRFVSEEAFRTAGYLADDEILVRAKPLPGSHRRLQDSPNDDAPLAIPRK